MRFRTLCSISRDSSRDTGKKCDMPLIFSGYSNLKKKKKEKDGVLIWHDNGSSYN